MSNDLVSVIVPTFNRAYCLPRAINSALAQSHRNMEVLVIDDGSSDATREVVRCLYEREPRVRYFHQKNQGVSGARNTGIAHARGEFVALLDSDDYWYPWKLEVQLAAFRSLPDVGMIWTDLEAIDPTRKIIDTKFLRSVYPTYRQFTDAELFSRRYPLTDFAAELPDIARTATVSVGQIFSQMIVGGLVHTSTALLRRERLEKVGLFDLAMFAGEDYDFHLRTAREGAVAFINVSSIQYQVGLDDHLSGRQNRLHVAFNFLKTITPYLEFDRAHIHLTEEKIQEILAATHRWIGEEALHAGNRQLARKHFLQSLRHDWRQPRYLGLCLMTCLPESLGHSLRNAYRSGKSRLRPQRPLVRHA